MQTVILLLSPPLANEIERSDDNLPYIPVIAPKANTPEEQQDSGVAENAADPPPAKPKNGKAKPSCPPSTVKKKGEPHIHAVLKRSSTLPANDSTQICIDITGDKDGIEQDGLPQSNEEGSDLDNSPQTQFASIAPVLNASEKCFPTFHPNLQKLLASKAQQAAMNCHHFSSMNAALYVLSKGPWIPTHISVHVRQAALAAVGVGWSWVNQVPTTFPFSQYDACVSLATIDAIPANHVAKADALFALYATLCGNLSQMTRKFLFSKYEIRCSCCTKKFEVPVDLFCATVSSTTTIEMLANLVTPIWNSEEIQERQACSCFELDKATWKCLKLGPLSLIRLEAGQGERLPKIEDALLVLGHQFTFRARDYEIHCLITTNRLDQDSQLIILHSNQPGMVATYDHNNGLRIVETERVNNKLIIVGILALPVKSPKAILNTKELVTVAGALEATRYHKKHLKVVKGILKSPRKKHRLSPKSSQANTDKMKLNASERKARVYKPRRKQGGDEPETIDAIDLDGLPKTGLASDCQAQVGVISMFDGVGSVYHIIKKKLGKPPTIYIAAETDPVLRRLVSAELGLREDQQWGYTVEGVTTLYVKDVWDLLNKDSLILRQAKAMYPQIKWILIAGSPCQDLTYAGYLNGLLGLTGKRSMLFFVVYVVLCHLQKLFGFDSVRFLTENAGSMQVVKCDRKPNAGHTLDQSEHFQMFLYCLGLANKLPVKKWIWDTSLFYGIRRKRVFFRSHLDTAVPPSDSAPGDELWGPLIYLNNHISPLAPLLRTRGCTPGGALKLSWTGYQPCALMWNYAFFGGKRSFALLCQLAVESKFPKLPWASIVPAHFLPIWKSFIAALQAEKTAATRKDELIDQLAPIFHNPNITLPMRILTVQEVRKLSGLENVLTIERHGPALLTEKVVRDFCGNSFHPGLIDAAFGY